MRKTALVMLTAAALVAVPAPGAEAALDNWSGKVSSGGSFEHFSKARSSTMEVWVAVTSVPAKVQLITCDSRKSNIGVTRHIQTHKAAGMGAGTKNQRFCMALARSVPADTNGILPGSGQTLLSGRIEY